MEFKKDDNEDDLMKSAEDAINQIKEKRYVDEINSFGVSNVISIGISFKGKECEIIWE